MKRLFTLLVASALLAGCKVGPDYKRPDVATPGTWRGGAATAAPDITNLPWWDYYRDPVLTNLIATALERNHDVRIAAARIEQALGGYRIQRSYLAPGVDASAAWTRGRSGYTQQTVNQFELFGFLSYEIDIWGRLRRSTEAARASLLASEEGRRAVYIGLISSVAETYFNLRALDQQLIVAQRTYQSRTNSLQLTEYKFDGGNGIVSELDVRQAETQVHTARAAIAEIERAIATTENALSVLLGNNPGPVRRNTAEVPALPPLIPAGLPSDLLLRRPDVLAAEQQLVAANADVGVARAAWFPRISLTAALGVQSLELADLFDTGTSRAWSFAPQAAAPIFNFGRTRAGVAVAEARREEARERYLQTIQNAFREVEDGLISVTKLREQLTAEEANVVAERARLELARYRYEEGVDSYSDVLDAERFLFNAELQAIQTKTRLLAAHASLYKALGGGWPGGSSDSPEGQGTRAPRQS